MSELLEHLEHKHNLVGLHCLGVAYRACLIAIELGKHLGDIELTKDDIEDLYLAGLTHDMAKVQIADTYIFEHALAHDQVFSLKSKRADRLVSEHTNSDFLDFDEIENVYQFLLVSLNLSDITTNKQGKQASFSETSAAVSHKYGEHSKESTDFIDVFNRCMTLIEEAYKESSSLQSMLSF